MVEKENMTEIEEAVKTERERCASVCDTYSDKHKYQFTAMMVEFDFAAQAIRKGEPPEMPQDLVLERQLELPNLLSEASIRARLGL